jgi:hypothetical protein
MQSMLIPISNLWMSLLMAVSIDHQQCQGDLTPSTSVREVVVWVNEDGVPITPDSKHVQATMAAEHGNVSRSIPS